MAEPTTSSETGAPPFSRRAAVMRPSAVREILKVTEAPDVISFAGGLPAPELFPTHEIAEHCAALLRAGESGPASLQYSTTEGYAPLRHWVCDHLRSAVALDASPDQVLIANGSQQALDLIGKVLLDPGDVVLMASPGYLGAIQSFGAYEAEIVGIPEDAEGLSADRLEARLRALPRKPKLLYLTPNFHNPTGTDTSRQRRIRIAQIAAAHGIPLVEDDPYGRLRFDGDPHPALPALAPVPHTYCYLGTSSKIMAPGLRVAWLLTPHRRLYEKLVQAKQGADLHTSSLTQRLVHRYVSDPGVLDAHVRRITDTYARRRDVMDRALRDHMPPGTTWNRPAGGMFLWATLPPGIDTLQLLPTAAARKVAFVPGAAFFPEPHNAATNAMRLNFSNAPEDRIREGIARLAAVTREALR